MSYTTQRGDQSCIVQVQGEVEGHLGDETRQSPQKYDDEQQNDPDEILLLVVYQAAYGLCSIAERVGGPVAERVHLLIVEVVDQRVVEHAIRREGSRNAELLY